jgi:hypothetical protein
VSPVEYSRYHTKHYVEPDTGILRKTQVVHSKNNKNKPVTRINDSNTTQLHKINGIWYRVTLKEFPHYPLVSDSGYGYQFVNNYGMIKDVVLDKTLHSLSQNKRLIKETYGYDFKFETPSFLLGFHKGLFYAAYKKQLNKKELVKFNLKNESALR